MTIPETMHAVVLTGHGGIEKLEFRDSWPTPQPAADQVLIKVGACGLNNTDVNTRSGWYSKSVNEATTGDGYQDVSQTDPTWGGKPLTFPRIQGADVAGTVVAVGTGADKTLLGKRVITDNWLRDWDNPLDKSKSAYYGSECDGGYAQYTVIDYRNVGVVDVALSDAELATFSCSYSTAEGMLSRAEVTDRDVVLVTGASGGVGSALVQLAKRRGATVVGLASDSKHQDLVQLGADVMLSRSPADLSAELQKALGRNSISVVADVVGGDGFGALIECLECGGRYVSSGAIAGPIVSFDLRTFYLNDLTFYGSTVVPPHVFKDLVGYIERGEVKPLLAESFPLCELAVAQQRFIDKNHIGNIVVTMD